MCGITGWFSKIELDHTRTRSRLESMVHSIIHRGPDDEGILVENNVALGHRRLSIIDLETGTQPLTSQDGKASIIFNGEIYNYKELRQQLIQQGHNFSTKSDTEVILQLYLRYGWEGFARLRGMYAFAIWDRQKKRGILARDPCGIKPLFISSSNKNELVFGSEAKSIIAGGHDAEMDPASLHLLMNFRYLPGNRSLFKDIFQLEPGTVLEWNLNNTFSIHTLSFTDVIRENNVMASLEESVRLHLTSDVEVGAYLSGGIDSATIASLAKSHLDTLRTFTVDVGDDPNEAANASKTAKLLSIENIQGGTESRSADDLARLIWHLELPKINSWQVSDLAKHASKYVKVVMSGLGGDELFYGYNYHSILHKCSLLHRHTPSSITRLSGLTGAHAMRALQAAPWSESERAALMLSALGDWPRVYALLRNIWDSPEMRSRIYGPRMLDVALPDATTTIRELWPDNSDPVTAANQFEIKQKMVNDLLWQEDRCSMAVGLEVRVPFVDNQLARIIGSLGRDELMLGGRLKGLMKNILAKQLPEEIMQRPKSGFQVNSPTFFHQELSNIADKWLNEDKIKHYGLFNPEFVRSIRSYKPTKGLRWHYFILYLMLTTHMWCSIFEERQWTAMK